ncbi:MAG TPA: ThiF family adenylyltransferase [Candidatus Paceibacterota bacterium]|nr:ThiF family adenylyltransferase [Candidatus Paceibacterota bacterium]
MKTKEKIHTHFLEKIRDLKEKSYRPIILDLSKTDHRKLLEQLIKNGTIRHVNDNYNSQLNELFAINNPSLVFQPPFSLAFKDFHKKLTDMKPEWQQGRWIFFPWSSTLVHVLEDKDFQRVRMARNRNLINEQEQERFYNATIGIAGLSVGNSVALAIVIQGGARHIKLADHDSLDLSNLNRIRATVLGLGALKVFVTARQIYEVNPYAKVELFRNGLTIKNIESFFKGLDVIVDEIDNVAVKYLVREQAAKHRIPVVMGVDNGDNGIIDVERYDLDPMPEFFHGRLGNINYRELASLSKRETGTVIVRHIGSQNIPDRVWQSFKEMGKTLASWPQLGGIALMNGSAIAYVIRKILNKQPIINDRGILSLDQLFDPSYDSEESKKVRAQVNQEIKATTTRKIPYE